METPDPSPNAAERIARARMIVSYRVPGRDNAALRNKLLKEANIEAGTYKNWMNTRRPNAPSIETLVTLAATLGVPRRFAERGFDDLWENGERDALSQKLDALERVLTEAAQDIRQDKGRAAKGGRAQGRPGASPESDGE